MILWSIQHRVAYDRMLHTGMLVADERYQFCENDLRFAYDWMTEQMVFQPVQAVMASPYL
ncbi:MAG: DUF3841 domain-containing protein [Clostridiales bacterium]|nr:DUF3841 domain-containing protein [Clostridiales bacterium]